MNLIRNTLLICLGFAIVLLYLFDYIMSKDAVVGLLFGIFILKLIAINANEIYLKEEMTSLKNFMMDNKK